MERKAAEDAFKKFLDHRENTPAPTGYPFAYDLTDLVTEGGWRPFFGHMVSDELLASINSLNEWARYLVDWQAWLDTLKEFEGDNAWSIRMQFVEPIVFASMFQPSATRDRFGIIATNAIHQANLSVDPTYEDRLDQDIKPAFPLGRTRVEKQLGRIASRWKAYAAFATTLRAIDAKSHREVTRNFRNLASHSIAPRFELGYTNFVTRSAGPLTETVRQADGTFQLVDHPTRRAVSYGFGGTPPLSLDQMREANEKQFAFARDALQAYGDLLREILSALEKEKGANRTALES